MLRLLVRAVIVTAVLMLAMLFFAEEIVVSAFILLTVALGTVQMLIGPDRSGPPALAVAVAKEEESGS